VPNEKGYEENTGWYPIQVVSPRQVQPALEGNDRKEDTEDKKPRQTPNHGDKNSERPCPLGDSCTAPFSKIITEYISFMLDSIASFSYNQPEEEQHDTMQPMSLANIHAPFQHTLQHKPKQHTNQETETETASDGRLGQIPVVLLQRRPRAFLSRATRPWSP